MQLGAGGFMNYKNNHGNHGQLQQFKIQTTTAAINNHNSDKATTEKTATGQATAATSATTINTTAIDGVLILCSQVTVNYKP